MGVAGAPPNHFHPFLVQNFGYSSNDDAASEVSDTAPSTDTRLVEEIYSQAQQAVSQVIKTSAAKLGSTGGGDAANKPQACAEYVSPALSKGHSLQTGGGGEILVPHGIGQGVYAPCERRKVTPAHCDPPMTLGRI